MKKIVMMICVIIVCIGGSIGIYMLSNNDNMNNNENVLNTSNENFNQNENILNNNVENENNNNIAKTRNILVLYFSATGNTEKIAEYIKSETNGDILEIIPKEKYTSEDLEYNNDCRANREQQDEKVRPEIANNIDITEYDTIFLGYPIWWGDVPKIILTLLDKCNFDGKTVIPFCTSGSTGIAQSQNTLKSYNKNMILIEGKRFSSQASQNEISSWIKTIDY